MKVRDQRTISIQLRPALCPHVHHSEDVFVSDCIRTAQTSHRAKEWLSVVSELTQRLHKGTQAACSVSCGSGQIVAKVRRCMGLTKNLVFPLGGSALCPASHTVLSSAHIGSSHHRLDKNLYLNPMIKPTGDLTPGCNFRDCDHLFAEIHLDLYFLYCCHSCNLDQTCTFSNDFYSTADKFSN